MPANTRSIAWLVSCSRLTQNLDSLLAEVRAWILTFDDLDELAEHDAKNSDRLAGGRLSCARSLNAVPRQGGFAKASIRWTSMSSIENALVTAKNRAKADARKKATSLRLHEPREP
ncbi:hypothetical protein AWB68_02554 [Caballeronia choica]|uniref:Uncharacterized protein n=1 Tax=Caballeronia choica TaxID=326476 RepID=A0A158I8E1_9BURK|nr:hypothetical protein [Caballeronia choica]SAL52310.1 hypothetical protein AWB68_02554 [Caballeronia choica]